MTGGSINRLRCCFCFAYEHWHPGGAESWSLMIADGCKQALILINSRGCRAKLPLSGPGSRIILERSDCLMLFLVVAGLSLSANSAEVNW